MLAKIFPLSAMTAADWRGYVAVSAGYAVGGSLTDIWLHGESVLATGIWHLSAGLAALWIIALLAKAGYWFRSSSEYSGLLYTAIAIVLGAAL